MALLSFPEAATAFGAEDGHLWLRRLCGMACGNAGTDDLPRRARGLGVLCLGRDRFEGDDWRAIAVERGPEGLRVTWDVGAGRARVESEWLLCPETGVVSRKDRLTNTGGESVALRRYLARFAFPNGRYEGYAQESRWSNESQGEWAPLGAGGAALGCEWARTTERAAPYFCLRERGADHGLAFHVAPQGNWRIRAQIQPSGRHLPFAVVELGLADEDLMLELAPGESIDLPEVLVHALPGGEPAGGAPALHRFLLRRRPSPSQGEVPVVYNTWFDQFDTLQVPRLREQVRAAAAVGCEVFVIDAGWFGPDDSGWSCQGDWHEKPGRAFAGRMRDFADEVRAAGLGFGLWMEPETFSPAAPALRDHPEWFVDDRRLDLSQPAAFEYLFGEFARLIETYGLVWIKIDFNRSLGYDSSGAELHGYYHHWYRLLDLVRARYPQVTLENCASGGMRLDLRAWRHFDCHFASDTVHPIDVLRISQATLLRFPPGRIGRWAVLRGIGHSVPEYNIPAADAHASLVTAGGATWNAAERTDLDFPVLVALPGAFGLSGDLLTLPDDDRQRLSWWVEFHKTWRAFLAGSVAHLLIPPRPLSDRKDWAVFQVQDADTTTSLVFAYHLADGPARRRCRLRALDASAGYAVTRHTPEGATEVLASGASLMDEGLEMGLDDGFHGQPRAGVWSVERR